MSTDDIYTLCTLCEQLVDAEGPRSFLNVYHNTPELKLCAKFGSR